MFESPDLFKKFGKIYGKGKIIFCEYEQGDELYFIISGRVKISKITRETEKVLAYLGAGEYLGEMAIFENKPRTATVIADEETKVLVLKKNDFYKLMEAAPNLVVGLIKTLSIRYINTEKQLFNLMTSNHEKRIINYLCEKCVNVSEATSSVTVLLEEMEALLNIKREDIVKILCSYEKRAHVRLNGGSAKITDMMWWIRLKKNKEN